MRHQVRCDQNAITLLCGEGVKKITGPVSMD